MLQFESPYSSQQLMITTAVVNYLNTHRQVDSRNEVGGQLFGIMDGSEVTILKATGPYGEDKKSKYWFIPSLSRQQKDITKYFKLGFHYLGDWHTHPEPEPKPSSLDVRTMSQYFKESKHEHNSFVMIIIGTKDIVESLWVSLHTDTDFIELHLRTIEK